MGFIRSAGHALGRHGVARVRVQSPGGGSMRVAVSLSAAAVHSGADCGVRMGCSALHVAGTLGMGAASGCNMRAAYCIHSGFFPLCFVNCDCPPVGSNRKVAVRQGGLTAIAARHRAV